MKKILFYAFTFMLLLSSNIILAQGSKAVNGDLYKISTSYGDIVVKLYDQTPLHKANFIKLVESGYYNGSIFHRVINEFMIQGGSGADGSEDPGYTIPAEIIPGLIHKKGALAAARMGDNVNPERASSGSQFYIVQGKTYSRETMAMFTQRSGLEYSEEEIDIYEHIGGTPHLDGSYTVFGEVVEGLDVIDKIAVVKTAAANKPVEDIKMTITRVEETITIVKEEDER